jgi:hypothetical protein
MMVVVAVVAVALGAYTTRRYGGRRAYLLKRAEAYASRRREFAGKAAEAKKRADAFLQVADGAAGDLREKNRKWADDELLRASLFRRVAEFDARQERRYRQAADGPWAEPPPESGPLGPPDLGP